MMWNSTEQFSRIETTCGLLLPQLHDFLRDHEMFGVKCIESVLKTLSTQLTIAGEKVCIGVVMTQNSEQGTFYVPPKLLLFLRSFFIFLPIFGVFAYLIEKVIESRHSGRVVVVDGASKKEERVTRGLGKQHEKRSDETDLCVICLDKKYNAVFVPCCHLCCCMTCSTQVKKCPLCRKPINKVLQIYRH